MNPLHLHKNGKQDQKKKPPRSNVKVSKKTENVPLSHSIEQDCFLDPVRNGGKRVLHFAKQNVTVRATKESPLQSESTFSPFLSSTKRISSYLEANRAKNRLVLQLCWRKAQAQKKRRLPTTSRPDKENYARTLSESFVNLIMIDGQKSKAEKIFSQTLKKLADHLQSDIKKENKREITSIDREADETSLPKSCVHLPKEVQARDDKAEVSLPTVHPGYGDIPHVPDGAGYTEGSLLILRNQVEKRSVYHLLQEAIDKVKPTLQVRKVRVARSIYQVPFIMKRRRQERVAIRWIIESAKKRSRHSGSTFSECLAQAVLEALMGQGQVREKRDQLHRTAEANRTYLRYRWW